MSQHQPSRDITPRKKASKNRHGIFRLVLFLLPILFFVMVELALQLLNVNTNLDLFVSGPARLRSFYVCNPNVARRYFVSHEQVPTPPNDYFRKIKPANGYRVFVLGGSTANGYPFGSNLMFSRILEKRLKDALPERTVEVVNVSMSAINTFALLDFVDDILQQEPDALLVYAGHNEFYGALGVASMIHFGRNRTFVRIYMQLTRLETFQAVRRFIFWLKKSIARNTLPPTATLMERMVAKQSIPLHSPLYQAGCRQFEGNLRTMLRKAEKAGVPVFLSTLVSNTADQTPFVSLDETESALTVYEDALALKNNRDYKAAREQFNKARDLDALRFRAPSEFNDIIRRLAAEHRSNLVDVEACFEAASPQRLVGDNLMLDHLHPSIKGYFLMADAFFHAMQQSDLLPNNQYPHLSTQELQRTWGYSRLDSLCGALGIRILKGGWPFQPRSDSNTALDDFNPTDFVEEIAKRVILYDNVSIREGHEILANHYEKNGDSEKALQEYKTLVALKAYSAVPYLKVSEALVKSNNLAQVPELINESLLFDESPLPFILLGEAYNGLARYNDAIAAFEQAQRLGAPKNDPHILLGLRYAYQATGRMSTLQELPNQSPEPPDHANVQDVLQSADALIRSGRFEQAQHLLEKSLTIQETGEAYMWLGQICLEKRQSDRAVAYLEKARTFLPHDSLLLYNLCIALVQTQHYERARMILQELEHINPAFDDSYDLKSKLANILE